MNRAPIVVLVASLALAGCESGKVAAQNEFGRHYSCPVPSVEVTEKPDVKWSVIALADRSVPEPPAEVKADPARYAKWNADQREQYEPLRKVYDTYDVFSATGCGHTALLGCKRPAKSATGAIVCSVEPEKKP